MRLRLTGKCRQFLGHRGGHWTPLAPLVYWYFGRTSDIVRTKIKLQNIERPYERLRGCKSAIKTQDCHKNSTLWQHIPMSREQQWWNLWPIESNRRSQPFHAGQFPIPGINVQSLDIIAPGEAGLKKTWCQECKFSPLIGQVLRHDTPQSDDCVNLFVILLYTMIELSSSWLFA